MSVRASAPPSAAARAITRMSVTFGVSFTINGSRVARRTAATALCASRGSCPSCKPPSLTFGQEMFISSAWTPSTPSRRAASSR